MMKLIFVRNPKQGKWIQALWAQIDFIDDARAV